MKRNTCWNPPKDPLPVGINQWQAAMQKAVQRQHLIFASLRPHGGDYLSTRQNRQQEKTTNQVAQRDPDAMDVDTMVVREGYNSSNWHKRHRGITEIERKKHQQEGRCFQCGQQGHMRCNCLKKGTDNRQKEGQGGKSRQGENARTTTAKGGQQEEEKPDDGHKPVPPPYTPNDLINNIWALNMDEQDELID